MVNHGWINKGQVDIFVKFLKLVLVYSIFYKNHIGSKKQNF